MSPRPAHRFRAVVFDLDGTLVDSAPDLTVALNRTLARAGRPVVTRDDVAMMVGDGVVKLVERGFAATGGVPDDGALAAAVADFIPYYETHATVESRPFPGAAEILEELAIAGVRLGLCTNKPQAATETMLAELGLAARLEVVIGGDALDGVRKPDPRHVLAVLHRLAVPPADAAAVGDSANDIRSAKAAGLAAVAVSFGYPRMPVAELGADAVIDAFDELGVALARLS